MDDQSKPDRGRMQGEPEARPAAPAVPPAGAAGDATPRVNADDATALIDPDATVAVRADDATSVLRPAAPESTSIMPPLPPVASAAAPGATQAPDTPERWSAKANVPRGQPPRDPDATAAWEPPEPRGVWWLPIVLAIIGLILLVGIAYVVITMLTKTDTDNTPAPAPTATATATPSAPPSLPSTPPSAAPSTVLPSTPAPAGTATVPSTLIGLPLNEAESILDALGIPYTTAPQPDDSALPNIVVNTSPGPGALVPSGGSVTLYYAQPSTPNSPATPGISASAGSGSPSA